ncbi:hypothetical protein [Holophaga foetida]|uniref:hypothetical protein n=1 Tax=Holophaga foetida TaxID=35839 RepID=UPI000247375F|nr:hypothetical protein [Holophaga foetida]
MRMFGALGAWMLSASLFAGTPEGLSYRFRIQFQGDSEAVEGRFRLVPTPVVRTRNRVKPPRLGGWQVESPSGSVRGALARVERLLYFAGPGPGTSRRGAVIRYGKRLCPVWDVQTSPKGGIYAYLVEVKPGVLALSYLSGRFASGDLHSVELQLERVDLPAHAAPAEEGTVLLKTLAQLAELPGEVEGITFLEERVELR